MSQKEAICSLVELKHFNPYVEIQLEEMTDLRHSSVLTECFLKEQLGCNPMKFNHPILCWASPTHAGVMVQLLLHTVGWLKIRSNGEEKAFVLNYSAAAWPQGCLLGSAAALCLA